MDPGTENKRRSLFYPVVPLTLRTRAYLATAFLFVMALMTTQINAQGQAATPGSADVPTLTLDQALSLAIRNNRQLQISGLDVVKARESLAEVRTNFFPALKSFGLGGFPLRPMSFTVPAGVLGVYPTVGPIPARDSTITTPQRPTGLINASADQPLTQLYKLDLATHMAGIGLQIAREAERAQHQETTRQVKSAYRQLAQAQAEVSSAEAAEKYLTELSELTDKRLAQQTVLLSDSLTVSANLKQQRYQLLKLQDAFEVQKESFNRLLGRDVHTAFSIEVQPAPEFLEVDLEAARKQALEQRPEIREARLRRDSAKVDIRRERAEYIPDLSLNVSYLSFQNVVFLPRNASSIGLSLSWQPFDWGYKKHRIGELKATAEQKVLSEQDTEQQVIVEVDQEYRALNEARVLLDADADARYAAQQKLKEMTNSYEQKATLLSSLLEQQSAVSKAETEYQHALASFWTAKADFERAIGED